MNFFDPQKPMTQVDWSILAVIGLCGNFLLFFVTQVIGADCGPFSVFAGGFAIVLWAIGGYYWIRKSPDSLTAISVVVLVGCTASIAFGYFICYQLHLFRVQASLTKSIKKYCGGELPPGCQPSSMYLVQGGLPWNCTGTQTEVSRFFAKHLGPEWEGNRKGSTFTRGVPQTDSYEQISVYVYDGGSRTRGTEFTLKPGPRGMSLY